jgi:hypothetical protein
VSTLYPKSRNIPIPTRVGLVSALRDLEISESVDVPEAKKSSIHPAARRAGVRVTLRTLGNGVVRVWRVSNDASVPGLQVSSHVQGTNAAPNSVGTSFSSILESGEDIFGRPLKKTVFD